MWYNGIEDSCSSRRVNLLKIITATFGRQGRLFLFVAAGDERKANCYISRRLIDKR